MTAAVQSMPGWSPAPMEKYVQQEESKYELDWADLVTLDLSQFDAPGGKQKLANQLRDAVHNVGFFYITNFGLSQEEVDYQFALGKRFYDLPLQERMKYRSDLEHGDYNGYRPMGVSEIKPGMMDNYEMYNIFKYIPEKERDHPDFINENEAIIQKFQKHIVEEIARKLLVLISIILEMPEDALTNGHGYDDVSECHLRYMIYRARSSEVNGKYGGIYSKGHSDFGSMTFLFRQPIAALQILKSDGTWKWVKPYPESITVNIADVLQFWTAGYLKSSIHRVVAPPPDQAHKDRLGLLFFLRPAQDLRLKTVDSPLLKRLGLKAENDSAAGIKAGDWVTTRVAQNFDKMSKEGDKPKEVLGGIKSQYYA